MGDDVLGLDEIDLSTIEFWSRPWAERDAAFATLRRERPIAFFDEPEVPGLPVGPGYYAITRHADVLTVSRTPEIFSSAAGAVSILDMPAEMKTMGMTLFNLAIWAVAILLLVYAIWARRKGALR